MNAHSMPVIANIEAEQNLLGCILQDNKYFAVVAGVLTSDDFSEEIHRKIFSVVTETIADGKEANLVTVNPMLPEIKLEGMTTWEYLVKLVSEIAMYDVLSSARAIVDDHSWRRVMTAADEIKQAGLNRESASPLPYIDKLDGETAEIRMRLKDRGELRGLSDAIDTSFQEISEASRSKTKIGNPWGFRALVDVASEPMQRGGFYGLMADSGGGKTAIALQIIRANAEAGIPCLFLSFEQTRVQCVQQMVSQATEIPTTHMRSKEQKEAELERLYVAHQDAKALPIAVQKVFDKTAKQLGILIRAFCRIQGPSLIVVDHAKRISPNPKILNLADQVNDTYGAMKNIALETDSSCLLLMQRNSKALDRTNARPIRADAYGGQSGPENLDAFIGLFREEQHLKIQVDLAQSDKKKDELQQKLDQKRGHVDIYGLKCRYGEENRHATMRFKGPSTKFWEYDLPDDPMGLL